MGIITHKSVDAEYDKWIHRYVDWEVESKIGYAKRKPEKARHCVLNVAYISIVRLKT